MDRERELVQWFGVKGRELDALRALAGGVTATELRSVTLTDAAFRATVEGLHDPNPRIRWWCVQLLDHVPDPRAMAAIATKLDDPVPRVRRNAAHALACLACKPDCDLSLPEEIAAKLGRMAMTDSNAKARAEAWLALGSLAATA